MELISRTTAMSSIDAAAASTSSLSCAAARVGFTGGLVALVLLLALHFLRPDLDPSSHFISEYAVGAHGWVMGLCFLSLAVACAGVLNGLFLSVRSVMSRIGLGFMLLATVGLTMAAFFPMDPITSARESPSFSGNMHGLAAMIGNPGFMIGAILLTLALRRHPHWAPVRKPLVAMTVLIWISFALMMASMTRTPQPGAPETTAIGWANRLLWAAYCGWVMLAVWPMMRPKRSNGFRRPEPITA